jgi:hypothetical protein
VVLWTYGKTAGSERLVVKIFDVKRLILVVFLNALRVLVSMPLVFHDIFNAVNGILQHMLTKYTD